MFSLLDAYLTVENTLVILWRDPRPGVLYYDLDGALFAHDRNFDRAAFGCKFKRVIDQIRDRALNHDRVGFNDGISPITRNLEGDIFSLCDLNVTIADFPPHFDEIHD